MPALPIVVPILAACVLLGVGRWLPRLVVDAIAFAAVAAVLGVDAYLLAAGPAVVSWTAGWRQIGIVLVADAMGTGAATLAAALMLAALVFSHRFYDEAEAHFPALMLLFLAGMSGFALSGDLFNMIVFFELMGAAAYALTGFKIEDPTSVQGALTFGIVNSLGAYISLAGLGLLYARTGALGLAPIATDLAARPAGAVATAGFALVMTGFLIKAAVVPFHFWLDDAHAVAPTPVCVLFSGIMVELGLYGVFRVTTLVFAPAIGGAALHRAFLVLGTVTALLGALMCFLQRHLKRLLAYSTIAHIGLFLTAFGTLDPDGTAAGALYVIGHAGIKGALFLIAGIVLNRYGSVDEIDLHGRGRRARLMPWLMLVGGLALAGLPPFGPGLGKALGEDAAAHVAPWAPAVFVLVSAVTGGAVLRAGARIYRGLGHRPTHDEPGPDTSGDEEEAEVDSLLHRVPPSMLVPVIGLLLAGLAVGVLPPLTTAVGRAAARFTDRSGYLAAVLGGPPSPVPPPPPVDWTPSGVGLGLTSAALAVLIAALALYRDRLPSTPAALSRPVTVVIERLRGLHSGHVGDYVTWLLVGVAAVGVLVAFR